jgi:hypothetical protein
MRWNGESLFHGAWQHGSHCAQAVSNSELYRAAVLEAGDRAQFALTQADPAAVGRLLEWAHTQYAKAGAQLATLAGHREGGVAIPAIGALAELMGLMHTAAAPHSIPLQTDWITKVRFSFLLVGLCIRRSVRLLERVRRSGAKRGGGGQAVTRLLSSTPGVQEPRAIGSEPLDDSFFVSWI